MDGVLKGSRDGQSYDIKDDAAVLEFFSANSEKEPAELVKAYLSREDFHGQDLNEVPGLTDAVTAYVADIRANGMRNAMEKIG